MKTTDNSQKNIHFFETFVIFRFTLVQLWSWLMRHPGEGKELTVEGAGIFFIKKTTDISQKFITYFFSFYNILA